ncbi:hypothetical protein ACFQ3N_01655 [Virgibacillus byunsanensis]|uniref:Uncharacterized protein n=1 Tax=Virgibacillus byunsanensis TaxID=570945 RepID=A0ABW3LIU6_9BACI
MPGKLTYLFIFHEMVKISINSIDKVGKMDRNKNMEYYKNSIKNNEVVKMAAIPQPREVDQTTPMKRHANKVNKNKRKNALEISESIGVYGAFNRTLSDLHKQGK